MYCMGWSSVMDIKLSIIEPQNICDLQCILLIKHDLITRCLCTAHRISNVTACRRIKWILNNMPCDDDQTVGNSLIWGGSGLNLAVLYWRGKKKTDALWSSVLGRLTAHSSTVLPVPTSSIPLSSALLSCLLSWTGKASVKVIQPRSSVWSSCSSAWILPACTLQPLTEVTAFSFACAFYQVP